LCWKLSLIGKFRQLLKVKHKIKNMKSEKENTPGHVNRNNQSDQQHQLDQANGNPGDPSSKRNIGLHGETQRNNQKDELGNLHIGGDETTGYGANNHTDSEENASGPGFEAEGSDTLDDNINTNS
jgi:hypothetical protein